MGVFHSMGGMIEAELTSADPGTSMQRISEAGIHLFEIHKTGDLSIRFRLRRGDYNALNSIAKKRGETLRLLSRTGIYWTGKRLMARPVLILGFAMLLTMTLVLPGRICFVQVDGNDRIPERLIIEKAAECGISFGGTRRDVRSEKVKNALLAAIPDLQWAGVNTKGCVAVISVREKTGADKTDTEPPVSMIVARRDGIIVSCTVEKGNALCQPGQAVRQGDILVSGYTDCGLTIRVTRSVGEILGQTRRNLQVVTPADYTYREAAGRVQKKYALIIGKKRINFYKDSGILGATCDKMSTVDYMALPGGFELPVALVTERWVSYDCAARSVPEDGAERILKDFADQCLKDQMIAGRILWQDVAIRSAGGAYLLDGDYACLELIGIEQSGEIYKDYGKNN